MNIRDEINKIIATNCYTEEDKPEDSVIMGEDFGKLADDLVKFCNLHFIIKQNKQLFCPSYNSAVSGSPSFEDWLNKYFDTPKMKMMYKRKDGKGEYDREKLIRDYKRAFRQS
jgi:hypothetical protein